MAFSLYHLAVGTELKVAQLALGQFLANHAWVFWHIFLGTLYNFSLALKLQLNLWDNRKSSTKYTAVYTKILLRLFQYQAFEEVKIHFEDVGRVATADNIVIFRLVAPGVCVWPRAGSGPALICCYILRARMYCFWNCPANYNGVEKQAGAET